MEIYNKLLDNNRLNNRSRNILNKYCRIIQMILFSFKESKKKKKILHLSVKNNFSSQ